MRFVSCAAVVVRFSQPPHERGHRGCGWCLGRGVSGQPFGREPIGTHGADPITDRPVTPPSDVGCRHPARRRITRSAGTCRTERAARNVPHGPALDQRRGRPPPPVPRAGPVLPGGGPTTRPAGAVANTVARRFQPSNSGRPHPTVTFTDVVTGCRAAISQQNDTRDHQQIGSRSRHNHGRPLLEARPIGSASSRTIRRSLSHWPVRKRSR
jgi:hypothetical protein